ncbi:hypothetical protein BGZ58_005271, partial [Dissophora ornata]
VPVRQLFKCKDIHVRAWDSTLNTQPKDLNWNLMGMMNNCWYRVQVDLAISGGDVGELVLRFIHPTVPGPERAGGWMGPKEDEASVIYTTNSAPTLTSAISKAQKAETKVESVKPDAAVSKASNVGTTAAPGVNYYTAEMVSKHTTDDDCWIIHGGKVYDCTKFLKEHPGGAESITMNAGEDCTEDFDAIHSAKGREQLADYYIGELVESLPEGSDSASETAVSKISNVGTTAASGVNYYTAKMVSKHTTDDDCWIIHGGKVYDCTKFLKEHPGGAESITMNAGEDCTEDFDAIHSSKAREQLADYYIGDLVDSLPEASDSVPGTAVSKISNVGTTATSGVYTAEMVSKHTTDDDCWIIHGGKVYDCTKFLKEHPGGAESITMNAGVDCTEDFDAIHSSKAREQLADYYIGDLVESLPETRDDAPDMKK